MRTYSNATESILILDLKDKEEYKVEEVRDEYKIEGEVYFLVK